MSSKLGKHYSVATEFKKGGIHLWKGHNWGICKKCGKDHGPNPMLGKSRPDLAARNKTPIMREKSRQRLLNKERAETWCKNISLGKKGKRHKKKVKDGYYGNHNWIARREPNKSEQKISEWIIETKLPFYFTGNIINKKLGISPDWSHINNDKLFIEYDCSFWHPPNKESDIKRAKVYAENNCCFLILNEHDLKTKEETINKIRGFENEYQN